MQSVVRRRERARSTAKEQKLDCRRASRQLCGMDLAFRHFGPVACITL
jgi:hypothetical protein